jgi:hypothetical protein
LIQRAGCTGALELPGQRAEILIRGQDRSRRKVAPHQRRGTAVFVPPLDPGILERPFLPLARCSRVRRQHRTTGGGAQLPGRLASGRADDGLLHRSRMLIAEPGDLIGDHHGTGQVDVAGGERPAGQGQAAQRDGEAEYLVRGPPG